MSEEMQEKAREIGEGRCFEVYQFSAGGFVRMTGISCGSFVGDNTYRLRPDYQEESEIVEYEILDGEHGRMAKTGDGLIPIHEAFSQPDFVGFKFEDGSWHDQPIKPVDSGFRDAENFTLGDIERGVIRIAHATHVLFRGQK